MWAPKDPMEPLKGLGPEDPLGAKDSFSDQRTPSEFCSVYCVLIFLFFILYRKGFKRSFQSLSRVFICPGKNLFSWFQI